MTLLTMIGSESDKFYWPQIHVHKTSERTTVIYGHEMSQDLALVLSVQWATIKKKETLYGFLHTSGRK